MSFASQAGQSTFFAPILPVVVDAAMKSALVLIVAGVAVSCMRKCSAAARHLVWFLAVASLPLLPALSLALPGWHILPQWFNVSKTPALEQRAAPIVEGTLPPSPAQSPVNAVAPAEARTEPQEFQPTPVSSGERTAITSATPPKIVSPPSPHRPFNLLSFVLPVWLTGAALAFLPTALGLFSLWRLERSSRRETASSWLELLHQLVDRLNFRRAVALLKTNRRRMPMTWGIFRPKLLLPDESQQWTEDRRHVVLLHELAHAKRWDYLTNLVTQFVCALYWFNPLVWFAARQMIAERERACDDIVLWHGARPADYAEQILQIAAGLRLERLAGYGGIAMARPSKLEGRLRAILEQNRNRAAVTRTIAAAAVVLLAAVVIPMAMIKAQSPLTPLPTTAGNPERKGNLEELKRFLASPPPLEYALFYVTNDPASRFRLSSPTRREGTVAAEWPIDIFEGSWCNGNFWTRRLGPGSTSALGPVSGAFVGRSGDTYWNVVGSTVFKETVREREPEYLGPIGYAYPARPFGEAQFLRILTLGIPVAKPGTFQFDGNRFVVDREGGPKAHGELLVTNGWITGIRLEGLGVVNSYSIFEFTYNRHRDQIPWFFPSEITQKFYRPGKFTSDGYHAVFLKLKIADRELPASRFVPDGVVVPVGAMNLLAGLAPTNRAYYFLVGADGKLISTNSQVSFPGQGGGAPFEFVGDSKAGFTNARPFTVKGRVTDPLGNGIAGVTITAHCGMGTLFPTGETESDATGHYTLHFSEGMKGFDESSGQWRVAVQAATIAPKKAGWLETNLYRGGDLLMADKLPAPDENVGWKLDPTKVVLPNQPYELNFVMRPAARIVGQLSDEQERPMARTKIWIADPLPPSSSVLAETETDDQGRFCLDDVPTGYFCHFNIASAAGMTTRFESPGELALYLRVRESHGSKVLGPVTAPGESMPSNANAQSGTSTAPSIELRLGIRDVTGIEFRQKRRLKYPLEFRIKNIGRTNLSGGEILQMMISKVVVHARSAEGAEQQDAFRRFWDGPSPRDLPPGETYVDSAYGDLLSFIPSATNGVYEVWWTLEDLKSNSLRFKVANGEMTLVTDQLSASAAAVSVRERMEQLIRGAPVTTNLDLEIWQPGARNAFAVRSNVVQLAYYNLNGFDSNSVFCMVYQLPGQNRFYVGWDAFSSEPRHYYGPFTGNPFEVFGGRSGGGWARNAHQPDSKRIEPDNPLGLDDETLVRLFNLGKKLQRIAWEVALPPRNSNIVFHSVEELYANYINRDELGGDPFGSGKLRLEWREGKVRLYSVGPDGEWNRGELIKPGDAELKGDLGVEIEIGRIDIHWLAEGAMLDYLQGKHTARYLAKKGTHNAVQFPLPQWADEQLKFGPMTDGLRAAVELITTNGQFVVGRPIEVRFHIRNEADHDIQIASEGWRQGDEALVDDEEGTNRQTGQISYTGISPIVRQVLKPGQTATFKSASLELFPRGLERFPGADATGPLTAKHPVGYTAKVVPGKCTVRFRLRFPGWNGQLMDWRGELETGAEVIDLKATPLPNHQTPVEINRTTS